MRLGRPAAALGLAVLTAAGCGGGGEDGTVLVSAAASLTDAFGAIETAFEQANPGVDVVLNLGASSALRDQILEGAPVDVYAGADTVTMDALVDAGAVSGEPAVFATNRMVIGVPAGNLAGVTGLGDLADPDLLVGLCAEGVPCGGFAARVLAAAGVEPEVDTREPNVRALLTKLAAGELDAGIVYVTDAAVDPGVDAIAVPDEVNVLAEYPIAVVAAAPHRDRAGGFVAFVRSGEGRAILAGFGFGAP